MSFRFESLDVYKNSLKISEEIFILVEKLQKNKHYVFADQLLRACLSISNNIAEGSGSNSDKEFCHYLNIARRSVFECANMMIILKMKELMTYEEKNNLTAQFDLLSRKIQALRKTLL